MAPPGANLKYLQASLYPPKGAAAALSSASAFEPVSPKDRTRAATRSVGPNAS